MKTKNLRITIGCLFVLSFSTDLIRVYSKIRFSLNKNLDKLDKIQEIQDYTGEYTDLRTFWLVAHVICLILLITSVGLLIIRVIKFKMK